MINTRISVGDIIQQSSITFSVSTSVYAGLLFCGALGLLSFFILLIYLKTRERIYLYYCLFLLFNLLGGVINLGEFIFINPLFTPTGQLAGSSLELVTLLAFSAYCLFTVSLLDVKIQEKKLLYWILFIACGAALYGLVYPLIRPMISGSVLLFFIISRAIIMSMSITAILWVMIKIKSPVKNYFIIGSSWYFLGALLAILRETTSGIPFSPFYAFNATVYFQSGIFLETLCFALALSYRIYLSYEEKQEIQTRISLQAIHEKEVAQAEALALRIQINPHFLFNCLNALKYYIQRGQNKKATGYLVTFSQFIRMILDLNQKPLISLAQELDIIKKYLILEEVRFNQHFLYKFKMNSLLNINKIKIPPMLLQPFVEEALWNGFIRNEQQKRELLIEVQQNDSIVTVTIEENETHGQPEKGASSEKFHTAISRQLTAERVALFNKNYNGKITYQTQDKKDQHNKYHGTQTIIHIQYADNHFLL